MVSTGINSAIIFLLMLYTHIIQIDRFFYFYSCIFIELFFYIYWQRADTQVLRWDVCVEVGLRSSKRIIETELRDVQTSFKQLLSSN